MIYKKITINTTIYAQDALIAYLSELGYDMVEIEGFDTSGTVDEMWGDTEELAPEESFDGYTTCISFYLDETTSMDEIGTIIDSVEAKIREIASYIDIGEGTVALTQVDDADYKDNWKEFFSSFEIGDIFIKPSWEDIDVSDKKVVIDIDPGSSFGTGKHESTYMVLEAMQDYITNGKEVLDVGCGSGILSIAAIKLGAASAYGIDIDPDCIVSSYNNSKYNDIAEDQVEYVCGDLIGDEAFRKKILEKKYDIVFANILADTIIDMSEILRAAVAEGGVLIASGIIDFKLDAVIDALTKAGFSNIEPHEMGEWRSVVAK